jgi:uncharacterized membrane protein
MFFLAQNYLNRGFWGDEAWTSLISQLPYVQMLKTTAADFHPPGYYTIIGFVYKFLPPTEINTRLVSIVFYLLTIFLVYKLACYVRGNIFGVLSAVVIALNPIFFTYAFEARNYTMFAFAATGSIFYLIELSKKFTKPRATLFVFFTLLGVYTHYYMFFILCAQGLYLLLFDRKIFIRLMILYAIVAVLYAPWLKALVGQLTSVSSSYWIGAIDWKRTHYEALLRILGGEGQSIYRDILFPVSMLLIIFGAVWHTWQRKFEKPYLLILLWAILPFILATLPGLQVGGFKFPFRSIFFWRYLMGSSIPFSMLMVHSAQKLPKNLMVFAIVILISLSAIIDFSTFFTHPYSFREAFSKNLTVSIKPTDKIVTTLPSFAEVLYYRNANNIKNDLIVLPEGLIQSSGKSLLDTYSDNKVVTIADEPKSAHFMAIRDDNGKIIVSFIK